MAILALAACDRFTGADQQKSLDAEAIGYACRISLKTPEDCMKENDTHSPTSVLFGWKEADRDVKEKAIDPNMGKPVSQPQQSTPSAAVAEVKPAAGKAAGNAATAADEKPAAAAGKADQGAAEKKAAP